jgi:hypothetical protein
MLKELSLISVQYLTLMKEFLEYFESGQAVNLKIVMMDIQWKKKQCSACPAPYSRILDTIMMY